LKQPLKCTEHILS